MDTVTKMKHHTWSDSYNNNNQYTHEFFFTVSLSYAQAKKPMWDESNKVKKADLPQSISKNVESVADS